MRTVVKLPIGIEDIEEIRTEGFYYADKTGLITELLNNWAKGTRSASTTGITIRSYRSNMRAAPGRKTLQSASAAAPDPSPKKSLPPDSEAEGGTESGESVPEPHQILPAGPYVFFLQLNYTRVTSECQYKSRRIYCPEKAKCSIIKTVSYHTEKRRRTCIWQKHPGSRLPTYGSNGKK